MSTLQFPLINGNRPDFASSTMWFQGTTTPITVPIKGFNHISYDWSMDGQPVHGASRTPIGKTLGHMTVSASCTMYLLEYNIFIAALQTFQAAGGAIGGGYADKFFNVMLTYAIANAAPICDMLYGCTIKKATKDFKQGGEALMVNIDLAPVYILENLFSPNDDLAALNDAALNFVNNSIT